LEDLRWGALLHDVGKIAVDPAIHNKPSQLNTQEYEHMMTHSLAGAGIVRPVATEKTIEIILHHHDHYDGTGLGQTIKGDDIPLGARIVAAADTFDAMTSDRPYRSAASTTQAISEVKRCAGTQLDPKVVKAFLEISNNNISTY
jgi:putative two-component system response regulator